MKNSIIVPMILGVVLAGCTRTQTDSGKAAANDRPNINKPLYDEKAVAAAPPPTRTASTDPTTGEPQNVPVSAFVAANSPTSPLADPTISPTPTPTLPSIGEPTIPEVAPVAVAAAPVMPIPAATDKASNDTKLALSDRVAEWKLTADGIKNEFNRTGRVERSKTVGADEPTGPMDDVLISSINTKLQGDTEISALKLDVAVEKGVVTLSGTARSLDQIGKAVAIALDTAGVTQAISTVKLESAL